MFDDILILLKSHIQKTKILTKDDWSRIIEGLECIEDIRGQWDHPGKCTLIKSSRITMKNVDISLIGIDETGCLKLMLPECEYRFPGKIVLEIPINEKYKEIANELLNLNKNV